MSDDPRDGTASSRYHAFPIPVDADRNPRHPPREMLERVAGRVLDPGTALTIDGVDPRPTVYVGPRLVVGASRDLGEVLGLLSEVAGDLGWSVKVDDDFGAARCKGREGERPLGVTRLQITVASSRATLAPDGWVLLQQARVRFGIDSMRGVGLDHILTVSPIDPNPFNHSNPFPSYAVETYGLPGSGGRQPAAYVGPKPYRRPDTEISGRRPVVAVVDTGCGQHDWLDEIVDKDVRLDGQPIGYTGWPDPEIGGDLVGPLDGDIDPLSGHGTFIAGLVHQACPDANLVSWRVVNSDGPIVESDWIDTLTKIVEVVRRAHEGGDGGVAIDVLNLSMGYYHETPEDLLFDPTLYHLLKLLGKCGTTVVCSAGNDATARQMFPAAFAPWSNGEGPVQPRTDCVPIVSVGALNPDTRSTALFSNTGPWVRMYEPGGAVLSTMPPFQGGLMPMARTRAYGRVRESIDPDDFTRLVDDEGNPGQKRRSGGFALWSGTSFAAPIVAGKIACALLNTLPPTDAADPKPDAVARGWEAVTAVAGITQ